MATKRKKRLTVEDWVDIRTRYLAGEKVEDLAKEYGIAPSTISSRANREKWGKKGSLKAKAESEALAEKHDEIKRHAKENLDAHFVFNQLGMQVSLALVQFIAQDIKSEKRTRALGSAGTLDLGHSIARMERASVIARNYAKALKDIKEIERLTPEDDASLDALTEKLEQKRLELEEKGVI